MFIFSALYQFLLLSSTTAMGQPVPYPCGVSIANHIRLYDEAGNQLAGKEWRLEVYYGDPGENPEQFRPIKSFGYAWSHPTQAVFQGDRVAYFESESRAYIQLQVRVWNTNSAPTWREAVVLARCSTEHLVFSSKILQQVPWDTICECGGSTLCDNHRLTEFDLDRNYRFILAPITPELRIRPETLSDGLHLHICHRGDSEIVLESSTDLSRWILVENPQRLNSDEFVVPDFALHTGQFFRLRRMGINE